MEDLLQELEYWQEQADKASEHIKNTKELLEKDYLNEDGYKDDSITITYSKPSTSTSVDLTALQKKEPDLYNDLLKDYPKTTTRKGSFRYTFK